MKKLMMILAVFAICAAAMAQNAQTVDPKKPVDLTMDIKTTTTYETIPGKEISKWDYDKLSWEEKQNVTVTTTGSWWNQQTTYYYNEHQVAHTTTEKVETTHNYLNIKEDGSLGNSGLTYTITQSTDYGEVRNYDRQIAQGYFTVTKDVPANKVVAVQFLGAEPEYGSGNSAATSSFKIKDYGIYLYDTVSMEKVGDYLSAKDYNNYFGENVGLTAGTSFGVYYKDKDGNIIASTGDGMKKVNTGSWWSPNYEYVDAENGMLGNFDDDNHVLKIYDANGKLTYETTDKHFLCLSAGDYGQGSKAFNIAHFEFMLQTTIDDPYYPVNPNDFEGGVQIDDPIVNGDVASGQPLPGTLATLLIGSLCASTLRKKNKKH